KNILTWVRLPRLLIQYFNHTTVSRISNYIGRTARLDLATQEGVRARYVGVCVEVDLSKPLLRKYVIDDRTFHVEYENLENISFFCGLYGNQETACPELVEPEPVPVIPVPAETAQVEAKVEPNIGSWLVVARR
ncbi:hypothetical protein LINPERHAP2_LOCUS15091, partial [Linum perenne]